MIVQNNIRNFKVTTCYTRDKVMVIDLDTQVTFYLPLTVAFSYPKSNLKEMR